MLDKEGSMVGRSNAPNRTARIRQHPIDATVEVAVRGAVLLCHQTTAGSWICCAEEGAPSCARGFSAASAAARWEEAQILAE
jgi:hypothetical protein